MKNLVFTEQSILAFDDEFLSGKRNIQSLKESKSIIAIECENFYFFLTNHKKDSNVESIPFIIFESSVDILNRDESGVHDLLCSIHRIFSQFLQRKGTAFGAPAVVYHLDNKLSIKAFFEERLFISVNFLNTKNIQAFKLATNKDDLNEYNACESICTECESLRSSVKKLYDQELEKREAQSYDYNFDLKTIFDDDRQSTLSYNQWINKLSIRQKAFFDYDCTKALKLTGPAGTGKTLAMEMKMIKLLKEQPDAKILFTCHSWSVACQVSDFIDVVAPDVSVKVAIYPLLELAKGHVSLRNKDIVILGNDSFEGKCEQISILSDIIQSFLKSEWGVYRVFCSDEFISQIESVSVECNNFTWDLMIEIACVIGANGIMPTKNGLDKYKAIERRNWMLYLSNEVEKEVVYLIYERFMEHLMKNRCITSDQILNDYINFLSTYNWYYDRLSEGYDYIFVDEMQLFNDQERLILNYLSRDPSGYPKLVMALDPKQSIDEVYSDLGVTDAINNRNPETESIIESLQSFDFDIAYRYTKQILEFLKHVDASYPQMDLGHEWNNNIVNLKVGKTKQGDIPKLRTYLSESEEVENAIALATHYSNEGKRTAILSLQDDLFKLLQKKSCGNSKCHKLVSKNDAALVKYAKKVILISQPNYVIGLQFDVVILIGCYSIFPKYGKNKSYYQRRFLSDLYLGASRAKSVLELTRNQNMEDSPEFIENAVKEGLLEEIDCK